MSQSIKKVGRLQYELKRLRAKSVSESNEKEMNAE